MDKIQKIWEILTTFSEESLNAARTKCNELKFDPGRGVVSLEESFINLSAAGLLLKDAIEKQKLIQLPITVQNAILANLEAISKALTGLINGADEVVNLAASIEKLNTAIWQYGFHNLSDEVLGYQTKLNQIKQLDLEISRQKSELNRGIELKESIVLLLDQVKTAADLIQASKSSSESNKEKTDEVLKQLSDTAQKTTAILAELESTLKNSSETADAIEKTNDKVAAWAKEIKTLSDSAAQIQTTLSEKESALLSLFSKVEATHKSVEDLLPGATSAGLASAFKLRRDEIAKSNKYWVSGFIASLIALSGMVALIILSSPQKGSSEWWTFLMQRAPLTFPFIWLGWFFGRHYGHRIRLEEDYAFKESISRSFEGYKKQMKEISPDAALPQLCDKTLTILSEPPLRVFDRKTSDETPANSFFERLMPKRKETEKG